MKKIINKIIVSRNTIKQETKNMSLGQLLIFSKLIFNIKNRNLDVKLNP